METLKKPFPPPVEPSFYMQVRFLPVLQTRLITKCDIIADVIRDQEDGIRDRLHREDEHAQPAGGAAHCWRR